MASRKCFQNESLLFVVTVVLNIGVSQEPVSESFVGKILDLNTNIISLGKWPSSSPAVRRALLAFFSSLFVELPTCKGVP